MASRADCNHTTDDEGDDSPRPPSEAELNASANARDAAKGFDLVSDMEDDIATITNLNSALMLIAESMYENDYPHKSNALYGLANGIEAALESLKQQRGEAWHLLWGYGPGAHRVAKEGGAP